MTDQTINSNTAGQLRGFIERCERLDEQRAELLEDRREVLSEAKAMGFETKIINAIIRKRRKDPNELAEEEALMETYEAALKL